MFIISLRYEQIIFWHFRLIVTVCIDITQFGIAVVYVLLSAKNIHDFLGAFFETDFSFCYVVLIVGACLLPVTFLKSPQDFWYVVITRERRTLSISNFTVCKKWWLGKVLVLDDSKARKRKGYAKEGRHKQFLKNITVNILFGFICNIGHF